METSVLLLEPAAEPARPARKALVIDDVPRVARAVIERLSGEGWSVVWVDDGEKALEALKDATYDLLVTRLVIPGEPVLPIVRRLRSSNPSASILVWSSLWRGRVRRWLERWGCQTLRAPLRLCDLLERAGA